MTRSLFWMVVAAAIIAGIAFRVEHLERRQFRADESMTALRVSGHTYAQVTALFDGRIVTAGQILRFQRVDPAQPFFATISGLASEEPQTAPLFFVVDRLWAGIAGSSIPSLRFPSALASIATVAACGWLCFELTRNAFVSATGAALMSVSPFFIDYGAQARQYGLWSALILVASAILLRALRAKHPILWFAYGAALALCLYTDPLTLTVLAAHAAYVIVLRRRDRSAWLSFCIASGCALLAFAPWLWVILRGHAAGTKTLAWTSASTTLHEYVRSWVTNAAAVLFDAQWAHAALDPLALCAFGLIVYSVYRVQRQAPRDLTWFLATMAAANVVPLLLYDLVTGGHGSTVARFLIPLWIALLLYVAVLFGSRMSDGSADAPVGWISAFCAVVALMTASSAIGSAAAVWWDNHDYPSAFFARTIDRDDEDSLVLMNQNPNPVLLVVSHYVAPSTRFLLYARAPHFPLALAADTFLVMPGADALAAFHAQPQYALQRLALPAGWPAYGFYRIEFNARTLSLIGRRRVGGYDALRERHQEGLHGSMRLCRRDTQAAGTARVSHSYANINVGPKLR